MEPLAETIELEGQSYTMYRCGDCEDHPYLETDLEADVEPGQSMLRCNQGHEAVVELDDHSEATP